MYDSIPDVQQKFAKLAHNNYVERVRELLKIADFNASEEHSVRHNTRLTGNAYYVARFDQCWLECEVKFGDKTPSYWCWVAIIKTPPGTIDPYKGLVMSPDHDLKDINEGWYSPFNT